MAKAMNLAGFVSKKWEFHGISSTKGGNCKKETTWLLTNGTALYIVLLKTLVVLKMPFTYIVWTLDTAQQQGAEMVLAEMVVVQAIPFSKWVITPVISGLTLLIPFITGWTII